MVNVNIIIIIIVSKIKLAKKELAKVAKVARALRVRWVLGRSVPERAVWAVWGEETDFGHLGFGPANFGQEQVWPIQLWPIEFWPIHIWPILFLGSDVCHGGAPKGRSKTQKKWGPEGWGAKHFALFFPSPAPIFALFLSLSAFSWNFGGVCSAGTLKCARLEF